MISPINEIMFLFVTIKYLRLPTHLFKAKKLPSGSFIGGI